MKEIYLSSRFDQIFTGPATSCGLLLNGSAYCWGKNSNGEIGDNTLINKFIPTLVEGNHSFVSIAPELHTCGILTNGSALCWGDNVAGGIGDNSTQDRLTPTSVYGDYNFSEIFVGPLHTCGILTNGSALCWGRNTDGQLGDNSIVNKWIPTPIYGNYNFSELSLGLSHTCGILTNGSALCWGKNLNGQLGADTSLADSEIPIFVSTTESFQKLSSAISSVCGLTFDDEIFCWGKNDGGQLGRGTLIDSYVPMGILGNFEFEDVSVGTTGCGIIKDSKERYCWGVTAYLQTGEELTHFSSPKLIYVEDLISKEPQQFRIGLTYDGNLRTIYALRYFDYDLNEGYNHVVLSVGDNVKLFVNGELVESHEEIIIPKDILDDLEIGKRSNSQIDDLLIWNRSLSDAEVEFIYKSNLEKLNETSWSFTTSFSDLVEITYNYGVYVSDSFGWISSLRNLIVEFPTTPVTSGGGLSITYDVSKLEEGISGYYPENYKINFNGDFIQVKDILEEGIELNVSGEVIEIIFNETIKVDSDDDGFYDLEISLGDVNTLYADLTIKSIYEEIPAISEEVIVEGEVEEEKVGFFRRLWNWLKGLFS